MAADAATAITVTGFTRKRLVKKPFPEHLPRGWKVFQTVREKFTCRDCEKISLSTAADAIGACCQVLDPLLTRIESPTFASERIHGDDGQADKERRMASIGALNIVTAAGRKAGPTASPAGPSFSDAEGGGLPERS